jgi:hypothetical protein
VTRPLARLLGDFVIGQWVNLVTLS